MPFSRNSQHPQYLSSRTGTRSSTRLGPPPPYAPSSISAEPPLTMSRTGPLWNSKPDASCGVLDASNAIYLACTSWFSLTISASSKSTRIAETKPRIQRWMEFLSAYNFRLSYRRGQENANADFFSRLPLPPIDEDISGASALTEPDDLGVYLISACGFTITACPVPGVGLGGLTPPPDSPVLGGLPLTIDDFRTHRAPMPPTHMTARPRRPYATPPKAPFTTYAISALDDAPRSTRRTRCPPRVRTIARPPTVDSLRPPLLRLLRSARRRLRDRPA